MTNPESGLGMMIFSRSQALMSSGIENSRYADSGAIEHMSDRCDWMTNHAPIAF